MKNIWLWIVGGLVALYLIMRWKGSQATAQAAATVPTNPITNLWQTLNKAVAAFAGGNVNATQTSVAGLSNQTPSNSTGGSGSPSNAQIAAAAANFVDGIDPSFGGIGKTLFGS